MIAELNETMTKFQEDREAAQKEYQDKIEEMKNKYDQVW